MGLEIVISKVCFPRLRILLVVVALKAVFFFLFSLFIYLLFVALHPFVLVMLTTLLILGCFVSLLSLLRQERRIPGNTPDGSIGREPRRGYARMDRDVQRG